MLELISDWSIVSFTYIHCARIELSLSLIALEKMVRLILAVGSLRMKCFVLYLLDKLQAWEQIGAPRGFCVPAADSVTPSSRFD